MLILKSGKVFVNADQVCFLIYLSIHNYDYIKSFEWSPTRTLISETLVNAIWDAWVRHRALWEFPVHTRSVAIGDLLISYIEHMCYNMGVRLETAVVAH